MNEHCDGTGRDVKFEALCMMDYACQYDVANN